MAGYFKTENIIHNMNNFITSLHDDDDPIEKIYRAKISGVTKSLV